MRKGEMSILREWLPFLSIGLVGILILGPSNILADQQQQNPPTRPNAIGGVVGAPQTVGLTYQRDLSPLLRLRAHMGSAVLFSSAGARLQWGSSRNGWHPYGFLGYALIHAVGEDYGDPSGTTGYLWLGPGLNVRTGRWIVFGEVCALLFGDEDKGLGERIWIAPFNPAIAGGILFRF